MPYDGLGIGCSRCGGEVYPPGTTELIGIHIGPTEDGRARWTDRGGETVHVCLVTDATTA